MLLICLIFIFAPSLSYFLFIIKRIEQAEPEEKDHEEGFNYESCSKRLERKLSGKEKEKESEKAIDEFDYVEDEEYDLPNSGPDPMGFRLKVKLIIADTQWFRQVPIILNRLITWGVQTEFGLMHTGLLLGAYFFTTRMSTHAHLITGDKVIDWCNNSLVCPRQVLITHPKMTIDLCTLDLENADHVEKLWKVPLF